jgi:hypothetical protein
VGARLLAVLLAAVTLAGCEIEGPALDGPIAVNLHVRTTSSSVEVDAPGWFADQTIVYLCHAEPPLLPEPGPERVGWRPDDRCHDYGTVPSEAGLEISLPLDALAGDPWTDFAAAAEWYLFLVEVDTSDRVLSAIRSRFKAPRDVVAF